MSGVSVAETDSSNVNGFSLRKMSMFKIPQENTCSGDAEKVLSTSVIWIETSSAKRTYRYNYINFCAERESKKSKRYHGL